MNNGIPKHLLENKLITDEEWKEYQLLKQEKEQQKKKNIFKTKKKKTKEECWVLNTELVKWLNEHLKIYLEDASKIVDLDFYKHKYHNKTYTQREIIIMLIDTTNELLIDYDDNINWMDENEVKKYGKNMEKLKNKMYDLLKLVHWELWW